MKEKIFTIHAKLELTAGKEISAINLKDAVEQAMALKWADFLPQDFTPEWIENDNCELIAIFS